MRCRTHENCILIKFCVCPQTRQFTNVCLWKGHHHNGDRADRRPHILCTICVHSFGAWRKLFDCSRHKRRARKWLVKPALLTFSSISNRLAAISHGDFSTPSLGVRGDVGGRRWARSIARPKFLLVPYWQIWSIAYRFWIIKLAPKTSSLAFPTDSVTMTITALDWSSDKMNSEFGSWITTIRQCSLLK